VRFEPVDGCWTDEPKVDCGELKSNNKATQVTEGCLTRAELYSGDGTLWRVPGSSVDGRFGGQPEVSYQAKGGEG
jgi:hypothetical protein